MILSIVFSRYANIRIERSKRTRRLSPLNNNYDRMNSDCDEDEGANNDDEDK